MKKDLVLPCVKIYSKIIETCNRLSKEGKLKQNFKDEGSYKKEITQWALWVYKSKGTDHEVTKETLRKDLEKKLEKLPDEKQPEEKEKEKVVDTMWEHIDLTLKETEKKKG